MWNVYGILWRQISKCIHTTNLNSLAFMHRNRHSYTIHQIVRKLQVNNRQANYQTGCGWTPYHQRTEKVHKSYQEKHAILDGGTVLVAFAYYIVHKIALTTDCVSFPNLCSRYIIVHRGLRICKSVFCSLRLRLCGGRSAWGLYMPSKHGLVNGTIHVCLAATKGLL